MIIHIDMDAFYASVEERENPELIGKPLVVGGQPAQRGVVAAANYEARKYGVFSAMPMATAVRKCPELLIVPPRGSLYSAVSAEIRRVFERYTPIIEPLSLDEAFLDPSGSERLHGSAELVGKSIKEDIHRELELVASVGVAPNKFLAKLASDYEKPDGFTVIDPALVQEFLDPLPVGRIWGVGKAANKRLNDAGIHLVSDLRQRDRSFLDGLFGKYGSQLWDLAHGIDNRRVIPDGEAKSISQETTFGVSKTNIDDVESVISWLAEGVSIRLREAKLKGRTISIKIRFDGFRTITRSQSITTGTSQTERICGVACDLLRKALAGNDFSVRLVGVGMSNFGSSESDQRDLFGEQVSGGSQVTRDDPLDTIADDIRVKYGKESIRRGKSLASRMTVDEDKTDGTS